MEKVTIAANERKIGGSRCANRLRREGFVPGIVYGHGMKPLPIQLSGKALMKALHTKAGENVILDLNVEGVTLKESTCLIKDLQHHPVTDEVSHVDLTVISMTDKIKVNVPVIATHADESEGIKQGGILDVVHHEIEVECLPTAIPQKIEINVKGLKIGDSIHTKDLIVPEGVVCQLPEDEVIVAVHAPRQEEEPAAAAVAAEGAEPQQPEVIEKGKKEEPAEEAS